MNLQEHLGPRRIANFDHRHFHKIACCPLDGSIDRCTLTEFANHWRVRIKLIEIPTTAKNRFDVTDFARVRKK